MSNRYLFLIITSIFGSIWIGFSFFMFYMTLGSGGFSNGAIGGEGSYGNLIGFTLWHVIGGVFTVPMILHLRKIW